MSKQLFLCTKDLASNRVMGISGTLDAAQFKTLIVEELGVVNLLKLCAKMLILA